MSELHLKEIFMNVERYATSVAGSDSPTGFSKEENRILALQHVNRLNQRIGFLARQHIAQEGEMRLLQTFVNGLTIGLKNDNVPQIRSSLSSVRNVLKTLDP